MENRIETIDIAKGLGILLVVIGHSLQTGSYPVRVIWTFHMPLFFFLSGFCYNPYKYTFGTLLKTRVKQLFVPLLLFSALLLVLRIPVLSFPVAFSIWRLFPFALWFVFILFLTELLGFYIVRLPLYMPVLIGLSSVMLYNHGIQLPYSLSSLPAAIMFYSIGHKLRQEQEANANYINIINKWGGNWGLLDIELRLLQTCLFGYGQWCNSTVLSIYRYSRHYADYENEPKIREDFHLAFPCVLWQKHIRAVHQFFMYIASVHIKPILSDGFLEMAAYKIIQQIIMWSGILLTIWFVNHKAKWMIGKQ